MPVPNQKQPTLAQVAKLAGVSEITASRALRAGSPVAPKTRERVEQAALSINYVPNRLAGTLAGGSSRQIGVIVPSLSNIVFADVLVGVDRCLDAAGYVATLGVSQYSSKKEEKLIRDLFSWRPAGLILAPTDLTPSSAAMLRRARFPIVEIMDTDIEPIDMAVGCSHRTAGRAMAHYLANRGYRSFGYVGHDISKDKRAISRLIGYKEGLADFDFSLAAEITLPEPSSVLLGKKGLGQLLASTTDKVEAVFFANDDLAVGGSFYCQENGIINPTELGLAGFNGLQIGQALPNPLTTIASNRAKIGFEAASNILRCLTGYHPDAWTTVDFRILPGTTA